MLLCCSLSFFVIFFVDLEQTGVPVCLHFQAFSVGKGWTTCLDHKLPLQAATPCRVSIKDESSKNNSSAQIMEKTLNTFNLLFIQNYCCG